MGRRLLKDCSGDEPPDRSSVLEDLCKPAECFKRRNKTNCERNMPFDSDIGLVAIIHALAVRNVPPSTND